MKDGKLKKAGSIVIWWLLLSCCLALIAEAMGGDPEPWSIPVAAAVISWAVNET